MLDITGRLALCGEHGETGARIDAKGCDLSCTKAA